MGASSVVSVGVHIMKNTLIASLAMLLTVFLLVFLTAVIDSINNEFSDFRISAVIAGVATLVALVVLVIWAIPGHLLLNKLKKDKLIWYIAPALLPGFVFVYWLKPFGQDAEPSLLIQALFCSFVGAVSAVVFWYFAVYRPGRIQGLFYKPPRHRGD
ncbi:hypothetical protein [Hahella sp. HN01]|uniref:hypothetical protein n=1 Tax=Hahella sp. HN01 TaxID=2847262 RepID=UPI001C1E901A|nr:hypothetical protein [Hahella sp. HN01]MBU6955056.1 hypothetical protein [Hahella sp. HN01]